ncbi:MAG: IclR family transcriptional regulator [Meiothermus sp.]|uniref:IclR family transcriptional regulator n=1 Tax=Meiothermus sp. TaxID=1955249 RepID=UPI00262B08CF|nr:IclR family transcriptional regulator [Meiothermus sp.]MCS7059293.1 IclR family transcriptional regulator [Meiothermus sp.]MCX7740969.1 IclR family transcriptional regulator [Meiothermus sp.]
MQKARPLSKSSEAGGAQTLLRGLWLLEKVAEGVHDLEGLARALGLHKSTAHRILSTLVAAGYLRHEPRKGYHLGPKLIRLGFRAYGQLHLPTLARPHLERLRNATRETVHLAVLDGQEVVYIDKLPGHRELQLASQIGARFPAQSTALGKALLAWQARERQKAAFMPGLRRTERSIADWATLEAELEQTRKRGYALDLEENETGVRCIAAPIFNGNGEAVAAVSISTAAVYLPEERIPEVARWVVETAKGVSRELGA